MNILLLDLIATVVALAVGYVSYGIYYAKTLKEKLSPTEPAKIGVAVVAIFFACLAFVFLYRHFTLDSLHGAAKGGVLGLLAGGGHFALPALADKDYLKARGPLVWTVVANWFFAFVIVGLVVGAIAG